MKRYMVEEERISEIGTKPNTEEYGNKRKNNDHAYFSVYHAAPHTLDNCLKLAFAHVNTFQEKSPKAKR